MERLDLIHHKAILLVILIATLITGVIFGVKISAATRGTDGLLIIVFAMLFVIMAISFIIFTQVIHLREEMRAQDLPVRAKPDTNKITPRDDTTVDNAPATQRAASTKSLAATTTKRYRR